MADPRNLQELADSLAESANTIRAKMQESVHYVPPGSYMDALLDTRATVLAMIQDVNRRIANNNRKVDSLGQQACLDGRIEAYEDVRGETPPALHKAAPDDNAESYSMCATCGKPIKHLPAGQGWVHEATGMVVG